MPTFTHPIQYANQDFDEAQAAITFLGAGHVEWFRQQPPYARRHYVNGAWFANNLEAHAAYLAIERWYGLGRE